MKQPTETSPAYRGRRQFHVGPYHYCARCGSRVPIAHMEWQRGLLVCNRQEWDCYDTGTNALIGQREANIARVLEIPSNELIPDPKLIQPMDSVNGADDDIIF